MLCFQAKCIRTDSTIRYPLDWLIVLAHGSKTVNQLELIYLQLHGATMRPRQVQQYYFQLPILLVSAREYCTLHPLVPSDLRPATAVEDQCRHFGMLPNHARGRLQLLIFLRLVLVIINVSIRSQLLFVCLR